MYLPTNLKVVVLVANKNKQGLVPIHLKFTQSGKASRISLRKWIRPETWLDNGSLFVKEKGKDAPPNGKELNLFLRHQLSRAQEILLEYERKGQAISFSQFKEQFVHQDNQDFIAFCEREMTKREKSPKYASETVRSNWSKLNKLKRYKSRLLFSELTLRFLENYENHLQFELGNDVNTIFSAMKFVRTMLNAARKEGLTENYPFRNYKLKYKKNTRDRLTGEELEILQNLYDAETLPDNLQSVLQYWLFAAYTGLAWGDLISLQYEDIEQRKHVYLITKNRKKTNQRFTVPLIERAKNLIDVSIKSGKVFPNILTNQKSNASIKTIIATTTIKKTVTFHVARHSFATVALSNGIPKEVVQKMLGHATSHQTDLYAKVLDNYVIREMEKFDKQSPTSNFKEALSDDSLSVYKKLLIQMVATRITSGMSDIEMAQKLGMKQQLYQNIEKGQVQLGLGELIEIGRILDLDVKIAF